MLFLALAVACSLAIGMIFKYAGERGMDRMALLTANYAVALGLAAGLHLSGGDGGGHGASAGLAGLAVVTGALFVGGFFMLALATERAGMSLAIGVMRVSVVIPFLASWLVWGERPTPGQGAGLALAALAFFLIAWKPRPGAAPLPGARGGTLPVLLLLFCAGGLVDTCMKAFDEAYAATHSRPFFLMQVFAVAFAVGGAGVVRQVRRTGRRPQGAALAWGAGLGVVNYAANAFVLQAVAQLSGPFVFPANNIALVIGGALLGVSVWGERLSRLNWSGLLLAAAALVLLTR